MSHGDYKNMCFLPSVKMRVEIVQIVWKIMVTIARVHVISVTLSLYSRDVSSNLYFVVSILL